MDNERRPKNSEKKNKLMNEQYERDKKEKKENLALKKYLIVDICLDNFNLKLNVTCSSSELFFNSHCRCYQLSVNAKQRPAVYTLSSL